MWSKILNNLFKKRERAALFIDFDNLGPLRRMKINYMLDNISLESTIIRRVYLDQTSDWFEIQEWIKFFRAKRIDVKTIPPFTSRGKNAADMQIVVDAMDLAHRYIGTSMINHYILVSGDTDFIPLYERLKEMGIEVTVFANAESKGKYIDSFCNRTIEFPDLTLMEDYLSSSEFILSLVQSNSLENGKCNIRQLKYSLSFCMMKNVDELIVRIIDELVEDGHGKIISTTFLPNKSLLKRKINWSNELCHWFFHQHLRKIDPKMHFPPSTHYKYLLTKFFGIAKHKRVGYEIDVREYYNMHTSFPQKNNVLLGFLRIMTLSKIIIMNDTESKFVIYDMLENQSAYVDAHLNFLNQMRLKNRINLKYSNKLDHCYKMIEKTAR